MVRGRRVVSVFFGSSSAATAVKLRVCLLLGGKLAGLPTSFVVVVIVTFCKKTKTKQTTVETTTKTAGESKNKTKK